MEAVITPRSVSTHCSKSAFTRVNNSLSSSCPNSLYCRIVARDCILFVCDWYFISPDAEGNTVRRGAYMDSWTPCYATHSACGAPAVDLHQPGEATNRLTSSSLFWNICNVAYQQGAWGQGSMVWRNYPN